MLEEYEFMSRISARMRRVRRRTRRWKKRKVILGQVGSVEMTMLGNI